MIFQPLSPWSSSSQPPSSSTLYLQVREKCFPPDVVWYSKSKNIIGKLNPCIYTFLWLCFVRCLCFVFYCWVLCFVLFCIYFIVGFYAFQKGHLGLQKIMSYYDKEKTGLICNTAPRNENSIYILKWVCIIYRIMTKNNNFSRPFNCFLDFN